MIMTVAEYTRLVAQIAVLKEVAMQYPTKTIDNIIVQIEARINEIGNSAPRIIKQQTNDSGGNG